MKQVSLIIPVYNVEHFIQDSLLSALNQTYSDIEYILIDDCSTDHSMDIVQRICTGHIRKDNINIIRHVKNRGLSAARNTGIENATGDYIFFMDSDDTITSDCIEKQVSAIEKYNSDITDFCIQVIGGRNIFFEAKKEYCLSDKRNIFIKFFRNRLHFSACNKLIKRSILIENNIKFIEDILYEDWFFTFDLLEKINSVAVLPFKTYNYIIHPGSITTSTDKIEMQLLSKISLQDCIYNYLELSLDKKIKFFASQRLGMYRFQSSAYLMSTDTNLEFKRKYFKLLNQKKYKRYIGYFTIFTDLPFSVFRFLFYWPYKIYKMIVKQL